MRYLISTSNDPYFNIAAEEYLCKQVSDNLLFFYVNKPSVVVGKHQNALAESNFNYLRENQIPLLRRISGGGTVFHDLGNLNFSFHTQVDDPAKTVYRQFLEPVKRALQKMKIDAEISSRNDITVNGFKVTGHAAHVYKKRVLSHGTLLVSANTEQLSAALKPSEGQFEGKAIASVRSKVSNIERFVNTQIELNELIEAIKKEAEVSFGKGSFERFTPEENELICKLVEEKYKTWEWNYGYSPRYSFTKVVQLDSNIDFSVQIEVEKGIIVNAHCNSSQPNVFNLTELNSNLIGQKHQFESLQKTVPHQLCEAFF